MTVIINKNNMVKIPQFVESRSAGARVGSDFIGITINGAVSIYAGFYRKNHLEAFSRCILLVDKAQNLIGIQFGGDELGEGAYTLNHSADHKTAWISAGNFFKLNEFVVLDWYGKYKPEKFEDGRRDNVFMIDLDKKILTNRKHKNE